MRPDDNDGEAECFYLPRPRLTLDSTSRSLCVSIPNSNSFFANKVTTTYNESKEHCKQSVAPRAVYRTREVYNNSAKP